MHILEKSIISVVYTLILNSNENIECNVRKYDKIRKQNIYVLNKFIAMSQVSYMTFFSSYMGYDNINR